jgi:hypothetical protein
MNNNINNKKLDDASMLTSIWGPPAWQFLHCISFTYPNNPTNEEKLQFKHFFESVQYTLPCSYCRKSYSQFIITEPTILVNALDNRKTLTQWLYNIHNRINQKLGVDYGITYDDVVQKYESFRATCDPLKEGCIMPINDKQKCFQNAIKKDCPIIKLKLAQCFQNYAKKRNIDFNPKKYADIMINKNCDEWVKRNKNCLDIIQKIRLSGKSSIEQEGEFKGMPTLDELYLISMLSSTLRKNELIILAKKLGYEFKHKYVFVKDK